MKFQVDVTEFIRALTPVFEIATRETVKDFPYSNKITLKATKDNIEAIGFGGAASIVATIDDSIFSDIRYVCEEEGEATVGVAEILGYLKSFPSETIEVSLKKNKFSMALLSNKKFVRSMAIFDHEIIPIKDAKVFSQDFTIQRELLLHGLGKVAFAMSVENSSPHYHCIALTRNENEVIFSAGSGARFAVHTFEGKNVIESNNNVDMKFPKEHIGSLKNIFQNLTDSTINIKYSNGNDVENTPEQINILLNGYIIRIKDVARFDAYPNLGGIMSQTYSNRIFCDLKDWQNGIQAIQTNFKNYDGEIHNSQISVDVEDEMIYASPKTAMDVVTPIPINAEKSIVSGDNPWFCANSVWIENMAKEFAKIGEIEICFESQEEIKDLNNNDLEDEKKIRKFKKKPVLVKYPEKKDEAREIMEKFYIFFVISSM